MRIVVDVDGRRLAAPTPSAPGYQRAWASFNLSKAVWAVKQSVARKCCTKPGVTVGLEIACP